MTREDADPMEAVRAFVDRHRTTCLWYLREDYYPSSVEEARGVLDAVRRHGDLEAFREAARLESWLSRVTSGPSASS